MWYATDMLLFWMSTHLTGHDGGQVLLFINQHQILEGTGLEEEGVPFFQRHGRGELRLLIIITQVGNLVKVTRKRLSTALFIMVYEEKQKYTD